MTVPTREDGVHLAIVEATPAGELRGLACSRLVCDEYGAVPDGDWWREYGVDATYDRARATCRHCLAGEYR